MDDELAQAIAYNTLVMKVNQYENSTKKTGSFSHVKISIIHGMNCNIVCSKHYYLKAQHVYVLWVWRTFNI